MSDTIRRSPKNKENPFAQVSRGMLQDKTLSYEARGMLSYLLSKSGDWEVRVYDLQIPGCGRDKVYRVLDELRKRGYIGGHAKYQDEKGQWHWTPYDVYEDPSFNTEKPFPEKPYTDEPNTENTEIKQTKTTKKRLEDKDIEQQKRKEKDIALASDDAARKSRFENPDGSSKWPESDDPSTLRLEGNEQKSTQDEKAKGKGRKTTATTPPPVPPAPPKETPAGAIAAALGLKIANGDGAMFGKTAKKLMTAGIMPDEFAAYVTYWTKRAAQEGGWTINVNSIVGGGRISTYMSVREVELEKARLQAERQKQLDEQNALARQKHPEWFPDYEPPVLADPERIKALQEKIRAIGGEI